MPDRRFRNRVARRLSVFGPAGIVVLTGLLAYYALGSVRQTGRMVQHTHDVLDASSDLMTAMLDGETGQRGFLLTHDSTFLSPYIGAADRARDALTRLRALTRDNAVQQARVDTLDVRVGRRLVVLDSTVRAEGASKTNLAAGIVRFGPGRSLMTDIRRLSDSIQAEEDRLMVGRRRDEQRSTEITAAILLLGTLIAGLLAFSVNRGFDRALVERRRALDDVHSANDRLQESAIELEHQVEAAQNMALEAEQASEHAREALVMAEEAERRAERLQAATEAFTGAIGFGEVANLLLDHTMHALGASSGVMATVDRGENLLRIVAMRNVEASIGQTVSLLDPRPMRTAVVEKRPVLIENPDELRAQFPEVADGHARDGAQSLAAFPLITGDDAIGVLLVRFNQPHHLSPNDRAFMVAMSRIATETFERARLFDAERDARSAAEAANRAKAAFLASMSHELRTPLQAALGFAQLVRSGMYGDVNAQQSEVLGRVERSQMHLSRLIDDILDFARLEAGRVRFTTEPVKLAELIGDLAPLVEPQAVKKGIELSLLPPPDSLAIKADRHRVQQILVNLVGNAIKFTPENGMIQVGALHDGSMAIVSIRDTGRGIPADRLQAIFEPFVQVEDGLTRTATGAGLGLAISRDLARAMGGDLRVESELGKGSTFSVLLPLAT